MMRKEEASSGAGTPSEAVMEENQPTFNHHSDYSSDTVVVSKHLLPGLEL